MTKLTFPTRLNPPPVDPDLRQQLEKLGFRLDGWSRSLPGHATWSLERRNYHGYSVELRIDLSPTCKDYALELMDAAVAAGVANAIRRPQQSLGPSHHFADCAVQLSVTAYVGIGSRLYIRGDGPGLSWGRGVPFEWVGIGRWRWGADTQNPVRVRLLKDDEIDSDLAEFEVIPGRRAEVVATFPRLYGDPARMG
jgi:hypothetical protein